MKALILAAGYATRLYPLTKEYPKPLLHVENKPIIEYIIDKIEKIKDIDEIIIVTNSKFISKFRQWKKGLRLSKAITLVDDLTKSNADRRGAIGDLEFTLSAKNIQDDLLVIGGDNLFDGELKGFINSANIHKNKPVLGVYDIGDPAKAVGYGVVKLNKEKKVLDFQEKPKSPKSALVAMCLYYFPKETLKRVRVYLKAKKDKHDAIGFYMNWLSKKTAVYGFIFSGKWYDIGDHKFYNDAKTSFVQQ